MSKPAQILELERAYGVEFERQDPDEWHHIAYDLNDSGDVVSLALCGCGLVDANAISGFTYLTELYLVGNGLYDVSALAKLSCLTDLHLRENHLSDINALANLRNL